MFYRAMNTVTLTSPSLPTPAVIVLFPLTFPFSLFLLSSLPHSSRNCGRSFNPLPPCPLPPFPVCRPVAVVADLSPVQPYFLLHKLLPCPVLAPHEQPPFPPFSNPFDETRKKKDTYLVPDSCHTRQEGRVFSKALAFAFIRAWCSRTW